jgi:BlaI family penicillinase repressor
LTRPEGNLTAAQYEIMRAVWDSGSSGATVAEIWQVIAAGRSVGRTTVLNLVDRLEKRGWLKRVPDSSPARYLAAMSQPATAAFLAGEFVQDFFEGSASSLMMSLLGNQRLRPDEIDELRKLIDAASQRDVKRKSGKAG